MRKVFHFGFRSAVWAVFFGIASLGLHSQIIPNRYALILEDPPALVQVGRREDLQEPAAVNIRRQIEARQSAVRSQLDLLKVPVLRSTDTVMNAIFVTAAPDQLSALRGIAGVKAVVPVRRYYKSLNRALSLLDAPAAWNLVGGSAHAGQGVKIGILDDGIEQTNPMFQASSLPMPPGFPICSGWAQAATQCASYTNSKVIVARSYVQSLAKGSDPNNLAADSRPDDYTPSGRDGHGTAVASVAGGVSVTAPAVDGTGAPLTINGMAPGVYLGNYKIYGSPEVNDGTGDDQIIAALDDAVKDGMNIVSFSSGGPALTGPLDSGAACTPANPAGVACDLSAQAFENAAQNGLIIVAAAGNDGLSSAQTYPNFNSIESPGDAPSVIAVGATSNSHGFNETVQVPGSGVPSGLASIAAMFSDAYSPAGSVTAPLADVTAFDSTALACSTLPAGSLAGAFVLIERGNCNFSQKMTNAVNAGAAGAIFYMADSSATIGPTGLYNFDLPVAMISLSDGMNLKSFIDSHPGQAVTINPNGQEALNTPGENLLAGFSSVGPSVGISGIKPDLVAVGEPAGGNFNPNGNGPGIYMAASNIDPLGGLFSSDGFAAASGTSFATPLVAGAAAIVLQNHPNFSAAQVKSVLVNTASPVVHSDDSSTGTPLNVDVQSLGGGLLDAGAAAATTVTANPSTLSFGAIASLPVSSQIVVTFTNGGSGSVTLTIATASGSGNIPGVTLAYSPTTLSLAPGASGTVMVTLSGGSTKQPGEYSGAVAVQGAGVSLRLPYMYIMGDGQPANIFDLFGDLTFDGTVGQVVPDGGLAFKVTDGYGLPVAGFPVTFVSRGGGTISNPSSKTDSYGIAYATATLGSQPGNYSFKGTAGSLSYTYDLVARPVPTTAAIVNAAGFTSGAPVAPGSYVSIFGAGLSDTTDNTTTANLPLAIDYVLVSFDVPSANLSVPGHLIYVSPTQVNVQVPWELQGQSSAQVKVTIDQSYGTVVTVPLSDSAPGIYEFQPGIVAAQDSSFHSIGSGNPAIPGQTIVVYANGLGPVSNQPATGAVALSSPLSQTTTTPVVTIGGQQAAVSFSGLTPGYASLFQLNVVVPPSLAAGTYPISVAIGGKTSNPSSISVQ